MVAASIKGHFDGKAVVLDEPAALLVGQAVRVVVEPAVTDESPPRKRKPLAGFAKGMFEMRDDFNDPLEEFEEYM